MRIFSKIFVAFLAHLVGIIAAAYFLPRFQISHQPLDVAMIAILLALSHAVIRPILKLIFSPVILLTLGLFAVVINAFLLYALDFYSAALTITGLDTLLYATLIISGVTVIIGSSGKKSLS